MSDRELILFLNHLNLKNNDKLDQNPSIYLRIPFTVGFISFMMKHQLYPTYRKQLLLLIYSDYRVFLPGILINKL